MDGKAMSKEIDDEAVARVWHFARMDAYGYPIMRDGSRIEIGRVYDDPRDEDGDSRPTELCVCGYHGSKRPIDALQYAPGSWVSIRELWGDGEDDDDKLVRSQCRVIAGADATMILHEFACRCAEHALRRAGITDDRCWRAIEVKRHWMNGEVTLDAARNAALDTALDAAQAAAQAAAQVAAQDAAWNAALDAARNAARGAAWGAQNRLLRVMLTQLLEPDTEARR